MMATKRKLIKLGERSVLDEPKYDLCLKRIFACLTIADRFKMRRVCKRWKRISEMPWEDMTKLNCASSWTLPGTYVFEVILSRLEQVLRLCGKNLTHLDFSGQYPLGDYQPMDFDADVEFFTLLATHCPILKILDIYFLTPTPKGIAYMADHLNGITDFRVYDYDSKCNKALSSFFKKAHKLEAITFYDQRKHRSCLVDLPSPTMKKIHLDAIYDETYDDLIRTLERCKNLESFHVENCKLKDKSFSGVTKVLSRNAKSLRQLKISRNKTLVYGPNLLQPDHLSQFKNLRELRLSCGTDLNDKILEVIGKNCRQLKFVELLMSDNVTDLGIKALPNLDHIDLRSLPWVKGQSLGKMSNLKWIHFSHCGITDRTLHTLLDTAVNLEYLDFRSFDHHDIKELILHAIDVVKKRKVRIPLEIVLDVDGKVKDFRRGLLHVRNA